MSEQNDAIMQTTQILCVMENFWSMDTTAEPKLLAMIKKLIELYMQSLL